MTINLDNYRGAGTIVLSGRPKGVALRVKLNLDKLDDEADSILVMVPQDVATLNSSFFSGLFADSIRHLNEVGFRAKYRFDCSEHIRRDVESGIHDALRTSNPLGKPSR